MSTRQETPSPIAASPTPRLPLGLVIGLLVAIATVLAGGMVASHLLTLRKAVSERVLRESLVLDRSYAVLAALRDLEAAPQAYPPGAPEARQRHETAAGKLSSAVEELAVAVPALPEQAAGIERLRTLGAQQAAEAGRAVALLGEGRSEEAAAVIDDPAWKQRSAQLDELLQAIVAAQQQRLQEGRDAGQVVSREVTVYIFGNSLALLVLIAIGAGAALASHRRRYREAWLRSGQTGLAARIEGEARVEKLGEAALQFLRGHLGAEAAVLYLVEDGGGSRIASHGATAAAIRKWETGDGPLTGLSPANRSRRTHDPKDSPFEAAASHERLTGRLLAGGRLVGGIELGFSGPSRPEHQALLDSIAEPLGAALRSASDTRRLNELLDQSLTMAEDMRDRRDELNAKTIVLSERTENLRAAHAQLATQQTALERVNTRLGEKMELLENQKEELRQSQEALVLQAVELERANRYKSNFLANMSHELRTPLNSALILSKVLSENRGGRLTVQEVSYAETIHSAGSDLLTLINDILDLAKIEAGKVSLHPERILLQTLATGLVRVFEPSATLKSLQFRYVIEEDTPKTLVSDEYRLGQILKNLLSNAIKFTRGGEIELRLSAAAEGGVCFAVRDTGIGISEEHRGHIFEAFRQADGSTHREFGGTGLGLSISRELAQLLGGRITVQSKRGVGSVFTLELPADLPSSGRTDTTPPYPAPAAEAAPSTTANAAGAGDVGADGQTLVLIVEDDRHFAGILRDLATEFGFASLHTLGAGAGFTTAVERQPAAILLDVNLPDQSGLVLLERLKQDRRTRHIPVAVVSVADYRQQALEHGAVDYALKPVGRDQLIETFQRLQAKSRQAGRVLVVAGEARLAMLCELLAPASLDTRTVDTGPAALAAVDETEYDCVVFDGASPASHEDMLLEHLETRARRAPPVIVYASQPRDGAPARRNPRLLVVKEARTPARLLDEVTLFAHQRDSQLPSEVQRVLEEVRNRERALEDRRILLVEDDPRNIFALTAVLERKGAKVRIARNGREALTALAQSRTESAQAIDLVLMDIMMPEMDGITAIKEIRKEHAFRQLPIIALTAKAMQDDQAACLGAGANDYMAKPLDSEKLLRLIRVWMPA